MSLQKYHEKENVVKFFDDNFYTDFTQFDFFDNITN